MKQSKLLTLLLAVAAAAVLLSGAIAVPILCRPFYYAHIDPLQLEEATGYTRAEIKTAYDEMLDYCLGGDEFSTGVLRWSERLRPARLAGRGSAFWAGAGLGGLFLLVGGLAALDFDRAFVVFHSLFFPGKTNWLFDPRTDEIINILPEVFFRNCAILILAVLVLGCAGLIVGDLWAGRKARTAEKA